MEATRIIATYRLAAGTGDAPARAQVLALEQSVELPAEAVRDARIVEDIVARVESIEPQADGSFLARIALSPHTVGEDAGQLLNMLFGNSSDLIEPAKAGQRLPSLPIRPAVTMSRQAGCGALVVAQKLAALLQRDASPGDRTR